MKLLKTLLIIVIVAFTAQQTEAQFFKKLLKKAKKKIEREAEDRSEKRVNKTIDKGFDEVENTIDGKNTSKEKNKENIQSNTVSDIFPPNEAINISIPVTLKWKPVTHNEFKATGYEVYLNEKGVYDGNSLIGSTARNKTEFSYGKLKPNTTYEWSVKGYNKDGMYMPGPGGTFTTGNGNTNTTINQKNPQQDSQKKSLQVVWNNFDFVPGDKVIFEDQPNAMEENGEFPSRWDLSKGQVEIMSVNGENVIGFLDGDPEIIPYLKNANEDYLPEVFTVEFDIYRPANGNRFTITLADVKNQRKNIAKVKEIEINLNRVDVGGITSKYDSHKNNDEGNWIHVSLAYTEGKFKVYLDENRLINIPHLEGDPSGISIQCYWADVRNNQIWYMKNFRIAKGGVKYYDRLLQNGKIIANGIRFDVNKTTLKPESMGIINRIYDLMTKKTDINFSVEGHTDSDGNDQNNQTLSEGRAKTVMEKLIEMGISAERLSSKGWGESKPIAGNDSPEGKANNRRVEFVKIND